MSNKNEVFEYLIDQLRQQVNSNQCEDLLHEVQSLKNQLRDASAQIKELTCALKTRLGVFVQSLTWTLKARLGTSGGQIVQWLTPCAANTLAKHLRNSDVRMRQNNPVAERKTLNYLYARAFRLTAELTTATL